PLPMSDSPSSIHARSRLAGGGCSVVAIGALSWRTVPADEETEFQRRQSPIRGPADSARMASSEVRWAGTGGMRPADRRDPRRVPWRRQPPSGAAQLASVAGEHRRRPAAYGSVEVQKAARTLAPRASAAAVK
ncbi:hypothetical protein, partial [Streptomyces sp. NPDC005731]|uniref:hypothetical protein n=1 Tax=Streptomyces sp. NPDC005731 TaxID=3157056 RepID=UPI003411A75F